MKAKIEDSMALALLVLDAQRLSAFNRAPNTKSMLCGGKTLMGPMWIAQNGQPS
ncbi:MAG: hypothetical protein AAF727_13015 [Pseudomonadota bacterium]